MKKRMRTALAGLLFLPAILCAQQRTLITCDTLTVRMYHKGVPVKTYKVVKDLKDTFVNKLALLINYKELERTKAGSYLEVLEPMENKDCYEITGFSALGEDGSIVTTGMVVRASKRNKELVCSRPGGWYVKTSVKDDEQRGSTLSLLKNSAGSLRFYYPAVEQTYAEEWTISKEGICLVNWYKDYVLYRQKEYLSKDIMPYINAYLKTLKIDKSGRGKFRSLRLGYDEQGKPVNYNSRSDLRCEGCIEIIFPHPITGSQLYGMSIPSNSIGFVYGLNWGALDEPYLFFADPYDTKEFVQWLRENDDTITGKRTFKPFEK